MGFSYLVLIAYLAAAWVVCAIAIRMLKGEDKFLDEEGWENHKPWGLE